MDDGLELQQLREMDEADLKDDIDDIFEDEDLELDDEKKTMFRAAMAELKSGVVDDPSVNGTRLDVLLAAAGLDDAAVEDPCAHLIYATIATMAHELQNLRAQLSLQHLPMEGTPPTAGA